MPDPNMPDAVEMIQCDVEEMFQAVRQKLEAWWRINHFCDEIGKNEDDKNQLRILAQQMVVEFTAAGLYNANGRICAEFYRFEGDYTLMLKQSPGYVKPTTYDPDDIPF